MLYLHSGKTTDNLLKQAYELASIPVDRELDALLSSGEQVSISKLSILLNSLGYESVSLTGWQAGIHTNNTNQNAIIENIDVTRINRELSQNKIVIVAGFQGINESSDITTLGRGGSDTTAVALAAALEAKHCYVFSDVDGVYTTDPNKVVTAKKLKTLSYKEMSNIADEGAKVLHNRCINIGEKFNIPIITKSTFNNKPGTIINNKIEETTIKSIVKNDNLILITLKYESYSIDLLNKLYNTLIINNIIPSYFTNNSQYNLNISLIIKSVELNKFQNILENDFKMFDSYFNSISKISVIGFGINNNNEILKQIIDILKIDKLDILNISNSSSKISILFKEKIKNNVLEQLHNQLIK